MKNIKKRLKEIGYNRDVEVPKEEWKKLREEQHRDKRSLAFIEHLSEPTYRDKEKTQSIELKDYRERGFDADFVAELEHYNPDKKPISHILIDFPLWIWRNRIKNQGPKQ